jgi:translation initiation factor IF-2
MTDTQDTRDKTLSASAPRAPVLRRREPSGTVRQSFSHGRSKAVVVEKKRKRAIAPPQAPTAPAAPSAPPSPAETAHPPEREVRAREAEKPAAEPTPSPRAPARGGVVLRTLTEEEKQARQRALSDARVAEGEARRRAEEEARRRAEEDARLLREREEGVRRRAEEEARKAAEEEARKRAEEEAKRRLEEDKRAGVTPGLLARAPLVAEEEEEDLKARGKRGKGLPVRVPGARRGEPRRRSGKLTINQALTEDERVRSLAAFRRAREREKRLARGAEPAAKVYREVIIPDSITVQELASRMSERAVDVIKELMKQGVMATINSTLDADTAQLIAEEFGHTAKRVSEADVEEGMEGAADREEDLRPRAPIVTVMGHVDHGKTSLLDALRATDVAAGEAGGITQHIGAYQVKLPTGAEITFLDTPGHAAFTAMRARGAKVTDIVVLVVAADDGVMPQTAEAISHAKAAGVPIIVAVNKIDKPEANPQRVKTDLLQHEIVVEEMGGDVQAIEVSATKRINLDKLEEAILLQAEILDLKANPNRPADGTVIEAKLDRGRGPVATVLVQRGTLQVGDIVVAGAEWGHVRALVNERGEAVHSAGPSVPVEVLGLSAPPEAGDRFQVVESESRARDISAYRQHKRRESRMRFTTRASLEQMFTRLEEGEAKELPIVVKTDVQGSLEAIVGALMKLGTEEVAVRVLHGGIGGVTESDVVLAEANRAPILAFNVRANAQAREHAQSAGVEIRYYSVIYDLVDDVKAALSGLLAPTLREKQLGNAEILQIFGISKVGKVAGCRVTEGVVRRGAKVRLIRDNVVIHEGTLSSLKRFKDEVREVVAGQECGMAFEGYQDMREGDVIECFEVETIARTL